MAFSLKGMQCFQSVIMDSNSTIESDVQCKTEALSVSELDLVWHPHIIKVEADSYSETSLSSAALNSVIAQNQSYQRNAGYKDYSDLTQSEHESLVEWKYVPPMGEPTFNFCQEILDPGPETVVEYSWIPTRSDSREDEYILQDRLAAFLGTTALRRRFPDLQRRQVKKEEWSFLVGLGLITPSSGMTGIVALLADEVVQMMRRHFPLHYRRYVDYWQYRMHIERVRAYLRDPLPRPLKSKKEFSEKALGINLIPELRENQLQMSLTSGSELYSNIPSVNKLEPIKEQVQNFSMHSTVTCSDSHVNISVTGGSKMIQSRNSNLKIVSEFKDSLVSRKRSLRDNETFEDIKFLPLFSSMIPTPAHCEICYKDAALQFKSQSDINNQSRTLIECSKCNLSWHPGCIGMNCHVVPVVAGYKWQCEQCKLCAFCNLQINNGERQGLKCSTCDRAYHPSCGLAEVQPTVPCGRWTCVKCGLCASCLKKPTSRSSGQWENEFTDPQSVGSFALFLQTHCEKCSILFRKSYYCPICLKVYDPKNIGMNTKQPDLIKCVVCLKMLHVTCDSRLTNHVLTRMTDEERNLYNCPFCRGDSRPLVDLI